MCNKLKTAEDQVDSNSVICPYCRHEYQPEGENYSEDEIEDECEECKKKFYSHQSFSVDHHTRGDCKLNGEEHDYQPSETLQGVPFCAKCDKCQPIDER
tara:strand:+ start:536 stop:832 length:297 start_codon:yes stop_codon:yes gene_type:complete